MTSVRSPHVDGKERASPSHGCRTAPSTRLNRSEAKGAAAPRGGSLPSSTGHCSVTAVFLSTADLCSPLQRQQGSSAAASNLPPISTSCREGRERESIHRRDELGTSLRVTASPRSPQLPAVSWSSSPATVAPAPSPTANFCRCEHKLLGSGLTLESPLRTTLFYGIDPALAQRHDIQVISDGPRSSVPRWHLRRGLPGAVETTAGRALQGRR